MQQTPDQPFPRPPPDAGSRRVKPLIALALVPAFLCVALVGLRMCGLIRVFSVPTGGMSPAVSPGDHILTERITFLLRLPRRGDIVVFKTDGIASLPPANDYVKRVAGEPGDHVRISEGKLFIDDRHISLSNALGEIVYSLPPPAAAIPAQTDLTVPVAAILCLGIIRATVLIAGFGAAFRVAISSVVFHFVTGRRRELDE